MTIGPRGPNAVTKTGGSGTGLSWTVGALGARGRIAFTTTGGSGTVLTWTLAAGGTGSTLDNLGNYKAGTTPNVVDKVTVTDSLGNSATATVTIGAALALAPLTPTVAPKATQQFTESGGSLTGFTWKVTVTRSGSMIDGTGLYTAGTTPGGKDTVCVDDTFGNEACTVVTIG